MFSHPKVISLLSTFCTLFLLVTEVQADGRCPSEEDIPLCTCSDKPNELLFVNCKNVNDAGFVKKLEKYLNGHLILKLEHLQVTHIPENFLGSMYVITLSIDNSSVQDINANAFTEQKYSLKYMQIERSNLKTFFSPALKNLFRLDTYLSQSIEPRPSLKVIKKSDTSNLPKRIRNIELSWYGIESIEAEAFARFTYLVGLQFRHNHLTTLLTNTLPASLRRLNLHHNLFSEIPTEILSLKYVHYLGMAYNKIRKLPNTSSFKGLLERGASVNVR
ncbi:Uncharacterised protein g7416 [Pycnogonum litorale]